MGVRSHWLRFTPLAIRALCVATLLRFLPAESRPKSFVDILDLRVIFLEIFLQRVLGCAIVTYPGRLFHTDRQSGFGQVGLDLFPHLVCPGSTHTHLRIGVDSVISSVINVKVHVTLVRPVPDGLAQR